jgi:hypothetical protein
MTALVGDEVKRTLCRFPNVAGVAGEILGSVAL